MGKVFAARCAGGLGRAGQVLLVAFCVEAFCAVQPAVATHERATTVSWIPIGGTTVEFSIKSSWRRTAYSTANNRCRDPNGLASVACSGSGGFPGLGDVIVEEQGGTQLDPGDGNGVIGSPLGPLLFVVTSIRPTTGCSPKRSTPPACRRSIPRSATPIPPRAISPPSSPTVVGSPTPVERVKTPTSTTPTAAIASRPW